MVNALCLGYRFIAIVQHLVDGNAYLKCNLFYEKYIFLYIVNFEVMLNYAGRAARVIVIIMKIFHLSITFYD